MSQGRCSGCGKIGSCREIRNHVLTCSVYGDLFRHSPDECLDPETDFNSWKELESDPDRKFEAKMAKLEARRAKNMSDLNFDRARWSMPEDPLADL